MSFSDASTPGSGTITGWSWSFGDGGSSTSQNPLHSYSTPGIYTVTLSVTADDGGADSEIKTEYITVTSPVVNPTADFSGTPTAGDATLAVSFSDASTPGSGNVTGWSWSFGDGGSSTSQNPLHSYSTPGIYTVTLSVTADDGGSDSETKTDYITVNLKTGIGGDDKDELKGMIPDEDALEQNFPNPFNPTTEIIYRLSKASQVKLVIYNTLGQHVKTLVSGQQPVGRFRVQWDGTNYLGQKVPSGLYSYRLFTGSYSKIRKMMLIR